MGGGTPRKEHLESTTYEESVLESNVHSATATGEIEQGEQKSQEPTQVRLVYSKSKVYIHPTSNSDDNIPGFLYIVEVSPDNYLLAWTPESLLSAEQVESYVQVECHPDLEQDEDESWFVDGEEDGLGSTVLIPPPTIVNSDSLYAASVPIASIYSIIVSPPKVISQWYGSIIINLIGGNTLPVFWFHDDESPSTRLQRPRRRKMHEDGQISNKKEEEANHAVIWGGDEFMSCLQKLCHLFSSSIEKNLFLINPSPEDLVNHSLPLPEPGSSSKRAPMQMDPLTSVVKEFRWNVLEKFSKVARFSRDTAVNILEHPLARPILPHLPPAINSLVQQDPTESVVNEFDFGRIYLAKWAARVAEEAEAAAKVEYSNEKGHLNKSKPVTWRADNVSSWEEETELGAFEILSNGASIRDTRTQHLAANQWFTFFDDEGKLRVQVAEVRAAVFRGGIEEDIRVEVWKFFLGIYPWDSSQIERENLMEAKAQEYWTLKRLWWDSTEIRDDADFQEQKLRIEKDVMRTDRTVSFFKHEDMPHPDPLSSSASQLTNKNLELMKDILMTYNFYNKDLGYVQGMSDLLAPVFAIMGDEVAAFWAFVGFMDRMKSNFYRDQSGMRRQLLTLDHLIHFMDPRLYKHLQKTESLNLFCCFRWLLIWFKREFQWDELPLLWEVLWSDHLTGQFHLFFALAILNKHRLIIMEYLHSFDEILKYINDLSMTINLDETLRRAETLFYQFQQMVETIDRKQIEKDLQENEPEGLRLRRGKEIVNDENIGENSRESAKNLPVVNELLRSLLSKDYIGG